MIRIHHTGSTGNLIQVDDLIIDPGVPIKAIKRALGFGLSKISGCLVSHSHGDHCQGAADVMKVGVDLYCSEETAATAGLSGHRLEIIEPLKQFTVGAWRIKPFLLVHDIPNLGFIMARGDIKALYACDTNYVPYRFTGLTHIILGVNYDLEILKDNVMAGRLDSDLAARIIKNHMSLQTAIGFFQANDMAAVEEIHLIHLSAGNSDAALFKTEIERVTARPVYAGKG